MSWGFWMPALLTSTSIRPKRWMVAATRPRTSTSLVTSPRSARALRPWPSISWTSACASASRAIIVHDQQAPLAIQEGERGALPDGDPAVPADRAHARRQRFGHHRKVAARPLEPQRGAAGAGRAAQLLQDGLMAHHASTMTAAHCGPMLPDPGRPGEDASGAAPRQRSRSGCPGRHDDESGRADQGARNPPHVAQRREAVSDARSGGGGRRRESRRRRTAGSRAG